MKLTLNTITRPVFRLRDLIKCASIRNRIEHRAIRRLRTAKFMFDSFTTWNVISPNERTDKQFNLKQLRSPADENCQ